MNLLLVALAIVAGLSNPIQSAANAGLNKALGQVLPAAAVIYGVALLGLLAAAPFLGLSTSGLAQRAASAPWWAWVGGLCNVCFVLAGALTTRQIGSAVFTVTVACCAIVLSIVLDRAGVMGLKEHPLTWMRLLGGGMAIGGIILVGFS